MPTATQHPGPPSSRPPAPPPEVARVVDIDEPDIQIDNTIHGETDVDNTTKTQSKCTSSCQQASATSAAVTVGLYNNQRVMPTSRMTLCPAVESTKIFILFFRFFTVFFSFDTAKSTAKRSLGSLGAVSEDRDLRASPTIRKKASSAIQIVEGGDKLASSNFATRGSGKIYSIKFCSDKNLILVLEQYFYTSKYVQFPIRFRVLDI